MKKFVIIALTTVLAATVAFVGWKWFPGKGDNTSTCLPRELTMVGRIDLKSMMLHSGMSAKDVSKMLGRVLRQTSIDDTGVDYQSTAYVFSSQGYFGAIIPLNDAAEFEQNIAKNLAQPFTSQRGLRWATLGNNNILIGVDKQRAMIMGPAVGGELDALRNTIATCMTQDKDDSGSESPLFALLETREEPIALASTYDAIPCQFLPEVLTNAFDLSTLRLVAGATVKKDRVNMQISYLAEDEKLNQFLDKIDNALVPVDGTLLTTAPTHPSIHVEMGAQGEKVLEVLRSIPELRTKLLLANTVLDADLLMKSIKGDVSLSYYKNDWIVQAQLGDDRVLDNVDSWNDELSRAAGVTFTPTGKKHGFMEYGKGKTIHYSCNAKRLTLSPDDKMANASAYHDIAYSWKESMEGNRLYAVVDINSFLFLKLYLPTIDHIVLAVPEIRQWNVEMRAPAGTNLFEFLD